MTDTKKGIVIGCRKLSIRKDPDVDVEKVNSNVKDSEQILCEVEKGSVLEVDDSKVIYDWTDRPFYKVWTEYGIEGYAPVAAIKLKEEEKEVKNVKRKDRRRAFNTQFN